MADDFPKIAEISGGFVTARVLQAAVSLGVFEAMWEADRPITVPTLAVRIGTDPRATSLLMDALSGMELVLKEDHRYRLSSMAETFLLPSSPRDLTKMIRFESHLWDLWGCLEESVRTGQPVRWTEMFQGDEEETALFIGAMDSLVRARGDADYLAGTLDLSGVETFLDIGSGPATYPIAFCQTNPSLRVCLFDLPGTLKVTQGFLEKAGMAHRIQTVTGDYRCDAIPSGFDRVFLSNVIHGENVVTNRQLFQKVYDALKPGGILWIKDHIMDESMTRPAAGAIFSLQMLMTNAGQDYSFLEVKSWMKDVGFRGVMETVLPPPMNSSLVSGTK